MSKIIILGAPLTGKTTLCHALRAEVTVPVLDFDEELVKLNNGTYPANYPVLNESLKNKVIEGVAEMEEVFFFAFEIAEDQLRTLRQRGFIVVQLTSPIEVLEERNQQRLQNDPGNDAFKYVEKNLTYQNKMNQLSLIDRVVDTNEVTVGKTIELILKLIKDGE